MSEHACDGARSLQMRRFLKVLNSINEDCSMFTQQFKRGIFLSQNQSPDNGCINDCVASGNVIVDKCILTFSSLVIETDILWEKAHNEIFTTVLAYDEEEVGQSERTESSAIEIMGNFLPCLQECSVFIHRCFEVFRNIILQLHNFFCLSEDVLERSRDRKLLRLWRSLGNLLSIFIYLDQIIISHSRLRSHWSAYMKAMRFAFIDPKQFNVEPDLMKPLHRIINEIDMWIICGSLFLKCVQANVEILRKNSILNEKMRSAIAELYDRWDKASTDAVDQHGIIIIVALLVFHSNSFKPIDKKLIKNVWCCHKRLPLFNLIGRIIWNPCEFLLESVNDIDKIIDQKTVNSMRTHRSSSLNQLSMAIPGEATKNSSSFSSWQSAMEENLKNWPEENCREVVLYRMTLFLKGARQADMITRLLKSVSNGHVTQDVALTRSKVTAIFRLIETVKAIESTLLKWWNEILESSQYAIQQWTGHLTRVLNNTKESLRNDSHLTYQNIDVISALSIAENIFAGAATRNRLIIAGISLELGCYSKLFRSVDVQEIHDILSRIDTMINFGRIIKRVCDCSFLYWHRSIYTTYFDSIAKDLNANVPLFFMALNDVGKLLSLSRHHTPSISKKLGSFIFYELEKRFLCTLCTTIEMHLRLSIHSHLQLNENSDERISDREERIYQLISLKPILLIDRILNIRRYVEVHLDKVFYNLNVIAQHDCDTYSRMRRLAFHKYGLIICESNIPQRTSDHSLDILIVTRNLHSFVTSYVYNLNSQFFIEKNSKSKHLNVLTVEQMANLIQTHGMGIMNTVINSAYQYLKKNFYAFSQFLFDEYICGHLARERRLYEEKANDLNNFYPLKRAQRLNEDIRKFDVDSDNLSILDKFRILISQIGNVMGYVRLVRSGGMEACSQSVSFFSDVGQIPCFESLATADGFTEETVEAAKVVDEMFRSLKQNLNQANNYLQILANAFSQELRNIDKHDHLNNFYMIIPSLTVNYIEHMLACRGKFGKRGQECYAFTDDGFILGVAFTLSVLNQIELFASLNWFQSVNGNYETELSHITQIAGSSSRKTLEPSVFLKMMKLDQYKKEFRLLYYTFNSAKIFFHDIPVSFE